MQLINDCGYIIKNELLIFGFSRNDLNHNRNLIVLILDYFAAKLFISDLKLKNLLYNFNTTSSSTRYSAISKGDLKSLRSELYLLLLNVTDKTNSNLLFDKNIFYKLLICIIANKCNLNLNEIGKRKSSKNKTVPYFEILIHNQYFKEINLNIDEMIKHIKYEKNGNNSIIFNRGQYIEYFSMNLYQCLKDINVITPYYCWYSSGFGIIRGRCNKHSGELNYLHSLLNVVFYKMEQSKMQSIYCIDFTLRFDDDECDDDDEDEDEDEDEFGYEETKYNFIVIPLEIKSEHQFQFLVWNGIYYNGHSLDE